MIHRFKTKQIGKSEIYEEVFLDDKRIVCNGYRLEHYVGEIPTVEIKAHVVPELNGIAIVGIANKKEIAEIMDKKEFEKFCKIWEEVHKND